MSRSSVRSSSVARSVLETTIRLSTRCASAWLSAIPSSGGPSTITYW
jgi:hypothetical protein